jgi:hypothetical protein
MRTHKINKKKDFIKGFYIDKKICDELINLFENSKSLQKPGVISKGVIKDIKTSTDIIVKLDTIKNNKIYKEYISKLMNVLKKYCDVFPRLNSNVDYWGITENIQIQRYLPFEGFYQWHCERASKNSFKRLLVFMTYLNDVKDKGETEWLYQKIKIKPEKGLTVIWPADWMYTHRGIPSRKEKKYIITGWLSFIN